MLLMKSNCERCDCELPAHEHGAMICSFECTFCAECVEGGLNGVCPNCAGDLTPRPTRAASVMATFAASAEQGATSH